MDALDLGILLAAFLFAASGLRRGLSWVGFSVAGLVAGLLIGALVARPLASAISRNDAGSQATVATAVLLSVVLVVQGLGTAIGYRVRSATLRRRNGDFARLDSLLGALVATLATFAAAWFLGLTFGQSRSQALDRQIQRSAVLRSFDALAPQLPPRLAEVGNVIRGARFPNPFASLVPEVGAPATLPASVDTPGVRAARDATVRVLARGCGVGQVEAGSGWPIAVDYLVTNAHVVAGGSQVTVDVPGGDALPATVVLYDPNADVAVLHVAGLGLQPLPTASGDPARGTLGAVIGYPGGAREQTVVPAAVNGSETARGYNIYNSQTVDRRIAVLHAVVRPGNSGGPVVDLQGQVIGLVFAASTNDQGEGYALTIPQVRADLDAGTQRRGAVSTQDCAPA
ncbi:MAG: acid resistance serine protease MarP [Candidatus Dormibacteria bacterium]